MNFQTMCCNAELFDKELSENVQHESKHFSEKISTHTIDRNNLNDDSNDSKLVSKIWSRYPDANYHSSRPGAFFPWPQNIIGKRIEKHNSRSISPKALLGIEIERRPPTNIPGSIRMAFGRAAPGYYAKKYPGKETWFHSNVLHFHTSLPRYNPFSRNLDSYQSDDYQFKNYLFNINDITEYQDKYLLHTTIIKRKST
ncbi:hypothetical protein MN116_003513 [Schistosoma mekongi]|uniref:Uncharacterized protein n=1 Tax=Schistosoma mekongi TaxID=38744 RepID=A0AAE2D5T0_SCHME|nr:hypothetical protein MN116_003513 [Schistosoma mekongi]